MLPRSYATRVPPSGVAIPRSRRKDVECKLRKRSPTVTVWTDHGLEAGERLRELLEFVRLLIRL